MSARETLEPREEEEEEEASHSMAGDKEENDLEEGGDSSSSNDDEEEGADNNSAAESGGDDTEEDQESEVDESTNDFIVINPISSTSGEQCTFDLKNLLAFNSHQVQVSKLYDKQKETRGGNSTITPDTLSFTVNEEHLLEKATDGCTQLIAALWQLPTERSDVGPLVSLPVFSETALPRELPPPPPKKETKWEKFAKERGIALNKSKRSQKVWDESTQTWMFRHGYRKANDSSKEWPIMEVKDNEDPYEDPWERVRDAKRKRVEKNMENRMRNQERAGLLPKGTATRTMKSIEKTHKSGKAGGNKDRSSAPPSGLPVDLKARKGSDTVDSLKRGRDNTQMALIATQRSTASLGNFDQMRQGEPERRKATQGIKKRKFESATDKNVIQGEQSRGMKVLKAVINGGGAAKEKAKRRGDLAKGETAYDFDFHDGLGASSFRKRKGRSGAGKVKKLTKKRIQ